MNKYSPLRSWVLIQPDPRKNSIGLIALPDQLLKSERVEEGTGRVVRLPEECWSKSPKAKHAIRELPFKVGDRVMFRGFLKELNTVEEDDKSLSLIHFEDILAVLDEDTSVGVASLSSLRA